MTRLVLVIVLLAAVPVAAQDRIVLGGPMRFSSGDIAFRGWFVGAAADVWRVEPFGYLSEDADVWAIVTGAGVPVWRGGGSLFGSGPRSCCTDRRLNPAFTA